MKKRRSPAKSSIVARIKRCRDIKGTASNEGTGGGALGRTVLRSKGGMKIVVGEGGGARSISN